MNHLRLLVFALAILVGTGARGAGLEVYPLFADLDAVPGETVELRIANTFQTPAAFSIGVVRRVFDSAGTETSATDASGSFVIFPPQTLIPAGGAQIVRLQWVDTAPISSTEYFDIVFEQLPLSLDNTQTNDAPVALSILVNVRARLYVNPPGSASDIRIDRVRREGADIAFDATNSGTRYHLLRNGTLKVGCGSGADLSLSGEELLTALGGSLVRQGTTRTFRLQAPTGCTAPTVSYERFN